MIEDQIIYGAFLEQFMKIQDFPYIFTSTQKRLLAIFDVNLRELEKF